MDWLKTMRIISFKYTYILGLVLCVAACSFRPKGEHWIIYFENNSQDTVLVFDYCWRWSKLMPEPDIRSSRGFGVPKENRLVIPETIKGLYLLDDPDETYEQLFTVTDSFIFYILPENYDGWQYHCDAKIVSYDLTLEDLVSLDFHLYYPPNEKMSGVKMDPPYETFVTND